MNYIKRKSYSKAIIFLISMVLYADSVPAQNLIINGGFETATVGIPGGTSLPAYPTWLDNWSAVNVDGEFIYDLSYPHSGTGFLSVLQNAGGNPVSTWLGAPWSNGFGYDRAVQIVSVTPSTVYQLQFWARSGAGIRYGGYDEGTVLLQVEQFSPSPDTIGSFTVYTPLAWQQSGYTFTTGSTCTAVAILFSIYDTDAADAWIDDVDLHVGKPTLIHSVSGFNFPSVFPTLFSDELKINSGTEDEVTMVIYDTNAQKIIQKSFTDYTSLNTENISKGIYFYTLRSKNGLIKNGKIVKQ
ncbi:MAG TPA: T9SS type A sorting domain-containing protein [Bacteroidia bacterium]|nr:T9SS type A sorting domain-containing protein [Bacteroidia bacterium]